MTDLLEGWLVESRGVLFAAGRYADGRTLKEFSVITEMEKTRTGDVAIKNRLRPLGEHLSRSATQPQFAERKDEHENTA